MSDTGGFPLVGGSPAFPGKNNVVRDSSGSNSFGWENLNVGNLSVVAGYRNKATGAQAVVIGTGCTASGLRGVVIGSGTASGSTSVCIAGSSATTTGSVAIGNSAVAAGFGSFSAGFGCQTSAAYAFSCGNGSIVSGAYSFGGGYAAIVTRYCETAFGGVPISASGDVQFGWFIFGNQSTSATPVILYNDGAGASKRSVLAAGARWNCTLKIQAATTGAIDKDGSWEYAFTICRPTTAASTIIRTTPALVRSDGSNAGAPPAGWAISITADTTNGCPQIQVTGDTDTINWTACLHYVQSIRV